MSQTVTLMVPDDLAQSARVVASQTGRRLEDVLVEWLDRGSAEAPIESWPDDAVVALRDLQLDEQQQAELDDLLAQQREGTLGATDRDRLAALLAAYRRGMVRKARALAIAVERGLQAPLGTS